MHDPEGGADDDTWERHRNLPRLEIEGSKVGLDGMVDERETGEGNASSTTPNSYSTISAEPLLASSQHQGLTWSMRDHR